jgi:SurA-like N-terminal domain
MLISPQASSEEALASPCPVLPGATVPRVADPYRPPAEALIACVGSEGVTGALVSHWYTLAAKADLGLFGPDDEPALQQTMQFLISADWITQEARERGVTVTDAAVRREFLSQKHQSFDTEADFRKYMKQSGLTVADVKYRVRLDLISNGVRNRVIGRGSKRARQHRLNVFVRRFRAKWRARTSCLPQYRIRDCGKTLVQDAPLTAVDGA